MNTQWLIKVFPPACLLLVSVALVDSPAFAFDVHGTLVIREVFVDDPLAGQASIMGKSIGTMPRIEFGEFGDIGFVSATDMEIVIELATTDPGEYLIIVTASAEDGGGDDCNDDDDREV